MKATFIVLLALVVAVGCGKKEPVQPSASNSTTPSGFEETKAKAESGNIDAQFNLGGMYDKGQGVEQDFREAVKWYQKAADQGFAPAQNALRLSTLLKELEELTPKETAEKPRTEEEEAKFIEAMNRILKEAVKMNPTLPTEPQPPPNTTSWVSDPSDPNNVKIEAKIREHLKKPTGELTKTDLEKVTELSLDDNQLTDVKGLEKLTQLEMLSLNHNKLTDVKGLEKLTQLKWLSLEDTPDLTKAQIAELQKALPKCIISNPKK